MKTQVKRLAAQEYCIACHRNAGALNVLCLTLSVSEWEMYSLGVGFSPTTIHDDCSSCLSRSKHMPLSV